MLTKEAVFEAVKAAHEATWAPPAQGFGCGRASDRQQGRRLQGLARKDEQIA